VNVFIAAHGRAGISRKLNNEICNLFIGASQRATGSSASMDDSRKYIARTRYTQLYAELSLAIANSGPAARRVVGEGEKKKEGRKEEKERREEGIQKRAESERERKRRKITAPSDLNFSIKLPAYIGVSEEVPARRFD